MPHAIGKPHPYPEILSAETSVDVSAECFYPLVRKETMESISIIK